MDTDDAAGIAALLRGWRFHPTDETDLHNAVEAALTDAGLPVEREVPLSPQDRIDLLCGTVGIEIKVRGPVAAVARQLQRYAHHPQVNELLLVTTVARHRQLPDTVGGVGLTVCSLHGAML